MSCYDHSNPEHRGCPTMPHEVVVPNVGEEVMFRYGDHGWIPAVVTKVVKTEEYQHLPGRLMSVYVNLDVPITKEQHHQGAEDVVMKVTNVGYSKNNDHIGMWCFKRDIKCDEKAESV